MNAKTALTSQSRHVVPCVSRYDSSFNRIYRGLLAGLGAASLLASAPALAATAPNLLTAGTYGVLSSTFTNVVVGTTINGDLAYVTGPAAAATVNGATHINDAARLQAGLDQGTALATLNGQVCMSLGAGAVDLNAINLGAGPGVFPPGCYSSGGAMNIVVNTTVTLNGAGVYIFRPTGALNTAANASVVVAGGACASDVFWAPTGATTLGANNAFVGSVLDGVANAITIGSTTSVLGRLLSFGGVVTTDTDTITVPTCAAFVPPATPAGATASSKAFFPTAIAAGGVSRLTITLSNNNAGIATLDAGGFTDTLPAGMVIALTPNAVTSCGVGVPTAVAGASTVSLPAGTTIPGGAPGMCTLAVNVTAAAAGSYTNTLPVLFTDQVESAAPAGVTLTVSVLPTSGIPTLSEWAMILLSAFLSITGFAAMRRQSR